MAGEGNGEKPKKGLFGRIGEKVTNAVFTTPNQPPVALEKAPDAPNPVTAATVAKSVVTTTGQLDTAAQEFQQMLTRNISGKGSAYTTFVEMLNSFTEIIPDESTRYKAALQAVLKQGITAEQILKAITVLLSSLETENTKFQDSLTEQQVGLAEQEKELPAKDEQISQLKQRIEETVTQLRQQITELEAEKIEIRQRIDTAKAKHDTILSSFSAALASLKNDLGNASVKVQKYLKGGE